LHSNTTVHSRPRRSTTARRQVPRFGLRSLMHDSSHECWHYGFTPRKSLTCSSGSASRIVFATCPRLLGRRWHCLPQANGRQLIAKFGSGSQRFVEEMLGRAISRWVPERRVYRLRRGGRDVEYYYFAFLKRSAGNIDAFVSLIVYGWRTGRAYTCAASTSCFDVHARSVIHPRTAETAPGPVGYCSIRKAATYVTAVLTEDDARAGRPITSRAPGRLRARAFE